VNTPDPVATPPSGLETVTPRAPVAADELMLTCAVIEVALLTVVEFTVIPDPENATLAPDANCVPAITTEKLLAVASPELGLVDATVGGESTVKAAVLVVVP
jgi:hypothetical protein